MTRKSDEGKDQGLCWIDAYTVHLRNQRKECGEYERLTIPHMGWNLVQVKRHSMLFDGPDTERRFYFVHSYHVVCDRKEDYLTTTEYGGEFISAFERDNIVGVQFHPKKGHRFSMHLIANFIAKF